MRIFTEKDKTGLARAFQTFLGYMNPQRTLVQKLRPLVEQALSLGLTTDEILNPANYERAKDGRETITPDEYISALMERRAVVRPLKEEEGWDDAMTFAITAHCCHDFFLEVTGEGGTYATPNAKTNLMRVITRNSLQGILSEKLISEVTPTISDGANYYRYITCLLNKQENFNIDNSLSEEQQERKDIETSGTNAENGNENEEPVCLDTEGKPDDNDTSIHGDEYPDNLIPEEDSGTFESTFLGINPKIQKLNAVRNLLMSELTVHELHLLTGRVTDDTTMETFISDLCDGKHRNEEETPELRNLHQWFNNQLANDFCECSRLQGKETDIATACRMDLLYDSWDLRDDHNRTLQKLKELVFTGEETSADPDLLRLIKDVETMYEL